MFLRRLWRPAAAGALLLIGAGMGPARSGLSAAAPPEHAIGSRKPAGAAGQSGALTALAKGERGEWELRATGGGTPVKLCITNPATLIQLRYAGVQCAQVVLENTPGAATVRYTCPGHGHGRTAISVETPRLLRVETQGIIDGAPFAEEYEGRRMGNCPN